MKSLDLKTKNAILKYAIYGLQCENTEMREQIERRETFAIKKPEIADALREGNKVLETCIKNNMEFEAKLKKHMVEAVRMYSF